MSSALAARPRGRDKASYNVAGQRLGRKGLETRERILSAMLRLIADPEGPPVTLTNIAREASVRLTNLYLYFPDFGTLLLAALERVMESADEAFIDLLRQRWPDEELAERAAAFLHAHFCFWRRNARLLHLRNHISDEDDRVRNYRQRTSSGVLNLLAAQMDPDGGGSPGRGLHMSTVLFTAIERTATVVTMPHLDPAVHSYADVPHIDELLRAEARLLELAIRDCRGIPAT